MQEKTAFAQLDILNFDRIAFAHSLVDNNYSFQQQNKGYGIYGKTPENGGVLEIGFIEQNPLVITYAFGSFLAEENSIFIVPPQCSFTAVAQNPGMHRHTSAEFLLSCRTKMVESCDPPSGRTLTLPLLIPPDQENREVFTLIRSIACAKTAGPKRSYFEECADFMQLLHKLNQRVRASREKDPVSPGNRRHCDRAKAFVAQNISRPLSISEVANAIGVSKNYLTNVFSSGEGIPLLEYINRRKLAYMMELIRRYGYTLAEAGSHVGYTDVNYISRIFKRYYGMTITEYKRSLEQKGQI